MAQEPQMGSAVCLDCVYKNKGRERKGDSMDNSEKIPQVLKFSWQIFIIWLIL